MKSGPFSPIYEMTIGKLEPALVAAGPSAFERARAIRDVLIDSLGDPQAAAGHLVTRISESVAATVRAIRSLDGPVLDAVRGTMLGVMHGTADEHVWATEVIEHVAASLVNHAIESREDVPEVTRATLESAREAAEDLAMSRDEAVLAAARGSTRAVREYSPNLCEVVENEIRRQIPDLGYHLATVQSSNGGNGSI